MIATVTILLLLQDAQPGRDLYMKRCFWCHGEQGRGDGPSAVGMLPRPRDFVRADYRVRSTPHGQLPTDEDLTRAIAKGLPGTPMPGWEKTLKPDEIAQLVAYLKSLSPRFQKEKPTPFGVPGGAGSPERGKEIYRKARCNLCHGEAGRGDGPITTTLNYEWGIPHTARDLTRGWTFKGGHEPRDIYRRITGGLNGTPMGPYADLLTDQERWDLAHYVASLDKEPAETSEDFVVTAARVDGEIPEAYDAALWGKAKPVTVALAGQVVKDAPVRWWTPTSGSATVRALWNGREIGFLVEWNDPTGGAGPYPDTALLQFAAQEGSKPYFLWGDADQAVRVWRWQSAGDPEDVTANGSSKIAAAPAGFRVSSVWKEGRWHAVFRRAIGGEPGFKLGEFVPVLFSFLDGANGESGNRRALSTWMYVTLEAPRTARPWLLAAAFLLAVVILEIWILRKVRS